MDLELGKIEFGPVAASPLASFMPDTQKHAQANISKKTLDALAELAKQNSVILERLNNSETLIQGLIELGLVLESTKDNNTASAQAILTEMQRISQVVVPSKMETCLSEESLQRIAQAMPTIPAFPEINIPETVIPPFPEFVSIKEAGNIQECLERIEGKLGQPVPVEVKASVSMKDKKLDVALKNENKILELLKNLENLQLLSKEAGSPISVQLSDGQNFYKAVEDVITGVATSAPSFKNTSNKPARAKLDDGGVVKTTEDNYKVRIEYTTISASDYPLYVGKAAPGSASSAAVWQVKKLAYSGTNVTQVDWADGNDSFDNIWDNRASLAYS